MLKIFHCLFLEARVTRRFQLYQVSLNKTGWKCLTRLYNVNIIAAIHCTGRAEKKNDSYFVSNCVCRGQLLEATVPITPFVIEAVIFVQTPRNIPGRDKINSK